MRETWIDRFLKWTNWAGTVLMPIVLFFVGQSIENKIDAQRTAQEKQQRQAAELTREISLLANVSPLLFSNDKLSVAFALQVMAQSDVSIPVQVHPLLKSWRCTALRSPISARSRGT